MQVEVTWQEKDHFGIWRDKRVAGEGTFICDASQLKIIEYLDSKKNYRDLRFGDGQPPISYGDHHAAV